MTNIFCPLFIWNSNPPVERDEVYVEIFDQAENFKKNNG